MKTKIVLGIFVVAIFAVVLGIGGFVALKPSAPIAVLPSPVPATTTPQPTPAQVTSTPDITNWDEYSYPSLDNNYSFNLYADAGSNCVGQIQDKKGNKFDVQPL